MRTLTRCRTDQDNAKSVARALVAAEAEGQKGHGLSRVPTYAVQAKAGKVDGFAKPSLEWRRPAAALIDAAHGFAYPALDLARRRAAGGARARMASPRPASPLASLRRRRPSGRAAGASRA